MKDKVIGTILIVAMILVALTVVWSVSKRELENDPIKSDEPTELINVGQSGRKGG